LLKPVQTPHLPLYVVRTSERSFRMAGERGFSVATGGPVPWTVVALGIATYKKACAAFGHTPHLTLIRPVYFGDDPQQISRELEPFLCHDLDCNTSPMNAVVSEDKKAEWHATGFGFYASGVVERCRDQALVPRLVPCPTSGGEVGVGPPDSPQKRGLVRPGLHLGVSPYSLSLHVHRQEVT